MNIQESDLKISKVKSEFEKYYQKVVDLIERKGGRTQIANSELMYIYCLIYKLLENANGTSESQVYHELSRNFDEMIESYLGEYLERKSKDLVEKKEKVEVLEDFVGICNNYFIVIKWILKAFFYYQKLEYLTTNRSIIKIGHDKLRWFLSSKLDLILSSCLNILNQERKGEPVDSSVLRKTCQLINAISNNSNHKLKLERAEDFTHYFQFPSEKVEKSDFYLSKIENRVYENTKSYYEEYVKSLNLSPLAFISEIEKTLSSEDFRVKMYFPKSYELLTEEIHRILILEQFKKIALDENEGFLVLLKKDQESGIQSIYNFFAKTPKIIPNLSHIYANYLEDLINENSKNKELEKNPIEYVKASISLLKKQNSQIANLFQNNTIFSSEAKTSLKSNFSKNSLIPKFLSFYTDFEYKKGFRGNSEAEIKEKIDIICNFLTYLHSKDAFVHYHSINLAKRLVNNLSLSIDSEKEFILNLKTLIGAFSVNKLEMMMNDVEDSKSITEQFISSNQKFVKFELNLKIITLSCWPESSVRNEWPVPLKLSEAIEKFENRYKDIFHGTRKLNWLLNEGFVEVSANFSKKYILDLSVLQVYILNMLNSQNLSLIELVGEKFNDSKEDFSNHVNILLQAGVIKKEKSDDQLQSGENSKLMVNPEFASPNKKLNLVPKYRKAINSKESKINQSIERDRDLIIDSTIVKVMKANKAMETNELMNTVAEMIKTFAVQPVQMKKRIENLTSREYLMVNGSVLKYIP